MASSATIIGIDPGTKHVGYGVVTKQQGQIKHLCSGVIHAKIDWPLPHKLHFIFEQVQQVLKTHQPTAAAIEKVFYGKNVASALSLGHARGVLLLAMEHWNIPIFEYAATEIKKSITGHGRAEKKQVQFMIKHFIRTDQPLAEDESDALAAAICHCHTQGSIGLMRQQPSPK